MNVESCRILIVEDDQVLRESVIEYLKLIGYQVTGAGSGREFYRALDAGSYDIAVIDVGLPDQSGLVLADYLRENSNTGIIILTARDSEEDQHSGYEAGADLYLTKPVSTRVLASAIAKLSERLMPSTLPTFTEVQAGWVLDLTSWTLSTVESASVKLTSIEIEFLKLLSKSDGGGASRDTLLQHIYPNRIDDYSSRSLDALVRRLRGKISRLPGKPNPLKSSYGIGYSFSEPLSIR